MCTGFLVFQEVNAELDGLEEAYNIDMSLVTDAPARHHHMAPPTPASLAARAGRSLSTRSSMASDGALPLGCGALTAARTSGDQEIQSCAVGPKLVVSIWRSELRSTCCILAHVLHQAVVAPALHNSTTLAGATLQVVGAETHTPAPQQQQYAASTVVESRMHVQHVAMLQY